MQLVEAARFALASTQDVETACTSLVRFAPFVAERPPAQARTARKCFDEYVLGLNYHSTFRSAATTVVYGLPRVAKGPSIRVPLGDQLCCAGAEEIILGACFGAFVFTRVKAPVAASVNSCPVSNLIAPKKMDEIAYAFYIVRVLVLSIIQARSASTTGPS